MAFGFFYGAAFAIDESDDGAHGMPVSSIEPSFAPLRPGSYRAAREAEDPVIRTRRMGEARM